MSSSNKRNSNNRSAMAASFSSPRVADEDDNDTGVSRRSSGGSNTGSRNTAGFASGERRSATTLQEKLDLLLTAAEETNARLDEFDRRFSALERLIREQVPIHARPTSPYQGSPSGTVAPNFAMSGAAAAPSSFGTMRC